MWIKDEERAKDDWGVMVHRQAVFITVFFKVQRDVRGEKHTWALREMNGMFTQSNETQATAPAAAPCDFSFPRRKKQTQYV